MSEQVLSATARTFKNIKNAFTKIEDNYKRRF